MTTDPGGAEVDRMLEVPLGKWHAEGEWLAVDVGRHTCGTGPEGHYGAHERGCGLEPIALMRSEQDAQEVADAHNAVLAALAAVPARPDEPSAAWFRARIEEITQAAQQSTLRAANLAVDLAAIVRLLDDYADHGSIDRSVASEVRIRADRALAAAVPAPTDEGRAWAAEGSWIALDVGHHTCGTGSDGYYGAHEPGCGLEPLADVGDPHLADLIVSEHNAAAVPASAPTGKTREGRADDPHLDSIARRLGVHRKD